MKLCLLLITFTVASLQADQILGDWSIPFDTVVNPITSTTPITATFQLPVGGVIEEVDFSFFAFIKADPIHVELLQGGTCYGAWNINPVMSQSFEMFFLTPTTSLCNPSNPMIAANQAVQLVASTTDSNPGDYAWLTNPEGALAYQFRWFPVDPPAGPPADPPAAPPTVPETAAFPATALAILSLSVFRAKQRHRSSSAAQSPYRLA